MAKRISNVPEMKVGIVGVSRNCFIKEGVKKRLKAVLAACRAAGVKVTPASTIIESEEDAMAVFREFHSNGVNAAVIYLGNFGPEGPTSIFAQKFARPVMLCGASEESAGDLIDGRGDAYCGMLNACYNFGLRNLRPHVPAVPVGLPEEIPPMIAHFTKVARVLVGMKHLKIITFGPRPQDFYACNAPIKPLHDLGVEVMENSELDLLELYNKHAGDKRINRVVKDMAAELGAGNEHPTVLPRLAQLEVTLNDVYETHRGASRFAVFANKCWPAFQTSFGFAPCYVNGRLAARGIPAACEVDIYGALSEYICTLATRQPATLLDINNTCPAELIEGQDLKGAAPADVFMGFHCGNTCASCMKNCALKYQIIMKRLLEPDSEPNISRGTLEGQLRPGPLTVFRLQGTAGCELKSYMAQGEILDIDPHSFGGIGIVAIPHFARFYRHVLLGKQYPHHTAVAFEHVGKALFDAMAMLAVPDVATPKPAGVLYKTENPFLM